MDDWFKPFLDAIHSHGVQIQNDDGSYRSWIDILSDLSRAIYQKNQSSEEPEEQA